MNSSVAGSATLTETEITSQVSSITKVPEETKKVITDAPPKKKINFMYPFQQIQIALIGKKSINEARLLRRDDIMKQDMERFLMELEEKHTWLAYELKERNLSRLKKEEKVHQIMLKEQKKKLIDDEQLEKETGLSFFRGDIQGYQKYQNSPAKHLDILGHEGSVNSVKLSRCLKYIVSCSSDKTGKIWSLKNGKCLWTFIGHTKKVNDISIHPNFNIDSKDVGIVTCSSDSTIRYWNAIMQNSSILVCHFYYFLL